MKASRHTHRRENLAEKTVFLGIEGGGTHTTAVLMDELGGVLARSEGGSCNLRLTSDTRILRLWRDLTKRILTDADASRGPETVGIFLAGCRTGSDERRMRKLGRQAWPKSRVVVGDDSQSAMTAALGDSDGVVLICGTGSIVRGRRGRRMTQVGGWGHVGGDGGSGYWMGRELLRAIFRTRDETGSTDSLGRAALAFLKLNTLEDLVQWSLHASKASVASLTRILFRFPEHPVTRTILAAAVDQLSDEVALACRKLGLRTPRVALNQGIAMHQPRFAVALRRAIQRKVRSAQVFVSTAEGALGAALLARDSQRKSPFIASVEMSDPVPMDRGLARALTEQRNPRTMDLHRRSIPRLVETMLDEESRIIPALRPHIRDVTKVVEWIVHSLKRGGRLFYVGAGTSGRLGVLDAAECPPTFGSDPEQVQGIIAGGVEALHRSVESAEDQPDAGRQSIRDHGITRRDVVVGIAASGSTPFVLGALREAHARGAKTVFLTFNPSASFRLPGHSFIRLAIATGPEILAGSTRLKAGTATKLILNMFTTIAMIRLGKVYSNLMIDLEPTCEKLHDRAARIYSAIRHISLEEAQRLLEKNRWNLKTLLKQARSSR